MFQNQNIDRIEGLLQQPSSPIPPDLREAFNDYLRIHHLWQLRLIALVAALAFFAFGFIDRFVVPDIAAESMRVRSLYLAIVLPLTQILYSQLRSMALLDLLIPLFVVIANILWSVLLSRSTSPHVSTYQFDGVIFTFVACIATQVSFVTAFPFLMLNAAVTLGAAYWFSGFDLTALAVFSTAYLPVLLFGLGGTWVLTTERRRSFLRSHINMLRTHELRLLLEREQATRLQYVRFGSLISHEFRNTLAIIDSQGRTLRKEHEHGIAQVEQRTTVIIGATRRLNDMFDSWLAGDRFQDSLQQAQPQRLLLQPWLRQWIASHADIGGDHPVELCCHAHEADADPDLLQLALSNLVSNAAKYSSPPAPIRIETRAEPGRIGIAVIDHGIGIAQEHQAQVLQAYFRVAPEGTVRGIGLGLAIVDRVAHLHGGRVELRSALGAGSDFCLWLPHGGGAVE